jgi:hypothetical protein
MAGTNLQYHEALKRVALENPHLDKQRAGLQGGGGGGLQGGGSGPGGLVLASDQTVLLSDLENVDALIDQKTREKVKESGGKLQYGEAMKLVASEHPQLDRRRTLLQRARARGGDE